MVSHTFAEKEHSASRLRSAMTVYKFCLDRYPHKLNSLEKIIY